jgi:hypothetical protein
MAVKVPPLPVVGFRAAVAALAIWPMVSER